MAKKKFVGTATGSRLIQDDETRKKRQRDVKASHPTTGSRILSDNEPLSSAQVGEKHKQLSDEADSYNDPEMKARANKRYKDFNESIKGLSLKPSGKDVNLPYEGKKKKR
jgi:hypothetical protein